MRVRVRAVVLQHHAARSFAQPGTAYPHVAIIAMPVGLSIVRSVDVWCT